MHIYSQRYIGCLENGFQRMIWNFTYSLLRFCSFKPFTYILCIWSINYLSPRQFFLFLKDGQLLWAVLGSQQIELKKVETFPVGSLPSHMHSLPIMTIPARGCICYRWWNYVDMSSSPRVHGLYQASLLVLCILWV